MSWCQSLDLPDLMTNNDNRGNHSSDADHGGMTVKVALGARERRINCLTGKSIHLAQELFEWFAAWGVQTNKNLGYDGNWVRDLPCGQPINEEVSAIYFFDGRCSIWGFLDWIVHSFKIISNMSVHKNKAKLMT